jgi:hypothetical protein
MKITRREERMFILKHILVGTMICIDIRTGAMRQF